MTTQALAKTTTGFDARGLGFHPACGTWGYDHDQHAMMGMAPVAPAGVTQRQALIYAVEFAEDSIDSADDPKQIGADIAAARRVLALPVFGANSGTVYVDGETFEACNRLCWDATDYARTCGYEYDGSCEPVERLAGSATGIRMVCAGKKQR